MRVLVPLFFSFSGSTVFSAGGSGARALAHNEIGASARTRSAVRAKRSTLIAGVAGVLLGERGLNRLPGLAATLAPGRTPRGSDPPRRAKSTLRTSRAGQGDLRPLRRSAAPPPGLFRLNSAARPAAGPRAWDGAGFTAGAAAIRATPWRGPAESPRPRRPAACLARLKVPQSASGAPGPAFSSRETRAASDAATAAGF